MPELVLTVPFSVVQSGPGVLVSGSGDCSIRRIHVPPRRQRIDQHLLESPAQKVQWLPGAATARSRGG